MSADGEFLYRQLGQIVADMPDLATAMPLTTDELKWLARAVTLAENVLELPDRLRLSSATNFLTGYSRPSSAQSIAILMHKALARAEANAPISAKGGFIPINEPFTALSEFGKIVGLAVTDVLIIDPYMDAKVVTDFATLVNEHVSIRLLFDSHSTKPEALLPAVRRWTAQHSVNRPLAVRQTSPRELHDRFIFVDGKDVWSMTQSLKDFAKRSPASFIRIEGDMVETKIEFYESVWRDAKLIN